MKLFTMTFALSCILLLAFSAAPQAQADKPRASLKASVSQTLGVDTGITIDYSRPGVKGRAIWGGLVPYGLAPGNKSSKDKPYPWRVGANENTTITVSKNILVEGKPLPAGKYGIHIIPSEKEWIIAFSRKNDLWGSYLYTQEDDALRITVKPATAPFEEWLTFGFDNLNGSSANVFLCWEKLKASFKVQTAQ